MSKAKKDSKDKKKSANDGPSKNMLILKRCIEYYDKYSRDFNTKTSPEIIRYIKICIEDDKPITKILFRPIPKDLKAEEAFKQSVLQAELDSNYALVKELKANYVNPPKISIGPLMKALHDCMLGCKELYIFDSFISRQDMVQMVYFIKSLSNQVTHIEIVDCLLNTETISMLSSSFYYKVTLSSIILDYNEFGDSGCIELCKGLEDNSSVISLSLNYCKLTSISGAYLGKLLHTTAIRELYLDGNELRCKGAFDLIREIALYAEFEYKKKIEEQRLAEEEAKRLAEEKEKNRLLEPSNEKKDNETNKDDKKKKKKSKKGKKKKIKLPPQRGSFVSKLHLADNSIDIYENGKNRVESIDIISAVMDLFSKLIKYSDQLEELDLDNNPIGNQSAIMLLDALEIRKNNKLGSVGVKVTEKIDMNLFKDLLKAGKKIKKKKRKSKKSK